MKSPNTYNLYSGIRFTPRTSHRNVWIFYVGISFFILLGLVLVVFLDGAEGGYAMAGLAALMGFIVWYQSSGKSTVYHINKDGVYLKRYYYKAVFTFTEMEDLKIINQEEAKNMLLNVREEEIDSTNSYDIVGAFKGRMDFGELIKFCSINVVMFESTSASGRFITGHNVFLDGDFVLLQLKNGKHYLISPKDNQSFIDNYHKYKH